MNFQELLSLSVNLNRQIDAKKQLHWTEDSRVQNAVVALDVELSEMANASEWFKVWKTNRGENNLDQHPRSALLIEYVDAMDFYLLIANFKNWNQVIFSSESALEKIGKLKPEKNLDKQYLALKKMLFNGYFNHSSASFEHSWKLFLKFGFVDFGFSESEIETAFKEKNKINISRQNEDY